MNEEKERLVIIDTTSLIYSACYNTAEKSEHPEDFSYYKETLKFYLKNILHTTKAKKYILFGDAGSSYRKSMFTKFKADRSERSTYIRFKYDLLHYARTELGLQEHPDLEADDMCLIAHNYYKDTYDVVIASKDSDLRQYPAVFFNYGLIVKDPEHAWGTITEEQAKYNFWKSVLIKGHNNKQDYLEGCGVVTAEQYFAIGGLDLSTGTEVLFAYINGINVPGVNRQIKGYGVFEGVRKFQNSVHQTYLFRHLQEIEALGITFEIPDVNNSLIEEAYDPEKYF